MISRFAYYFIIFPLSFLPLALLYRFSDLFYVILVVFSPYRKKIIEENVKRSFPHLSHKEQQRVIRKFYRHFSDLLFEGVKNLSISEKELRKRFKVSNPEVMQELYEQKRNVILVSGHYGNWEWLITSQAFLFPHRAIGIGMPLTSKFWDKQVNEQRQRFGMKVVHSKNFKSELKRSKTSPFAVLTLGDQSPPDSRKSYWTTFLHQQTAVLFGTEQMAHEFNLSVVYFSVIKKKRGYYEMKVELIVEDPSTYNWGEITELHTQKLQNTIHQQPELWLWSHNRWKREIPHDLVELSEIHKSRFNERFKK
jgi:KDO2-lipid IV(A) lauroyltransferase